MRRYFVDMYESTNYEKNKTKTKTKNTVHETDDKNTITNRKMSSLQALVE